MEDQLKVLKKARTTKEKERACENLRRIGKKEAVPTLIEVLPEANSHIKGEIAVVLGALKDPSAVPALAEAIDLSVGAGSDKLTQETNTANKEIARALGDIADKSAVDPLIKLLKATKDNYVRIEAINGLGKLKDPRAVAVLEDTATDDRLETFVCKKAILALAQINNPGSLPTYLKMLFSERKGVSFYPESAFGIFLLGDAAKDRILEVLQGKDKELMAWAKEHQVLTPAIYAKAAQIESDLQDRRAIPYLLGLLRFEDENPMYKLMVRMTAADTLGRLRALEAVGPISAMLGEEEANTRGAYVRALVQIGDKNALPRFVECSKKGAWSAREFCLMGEALLGGEAELKALPGFAKDEGARFDKECNDGIYGEVDCKKEKPSNVEGRLKAVGSYQKTLEIITSCKDNPCLEQALTHTEPLVRERAAYELGRRKATESLPALLSAVKREIKDVVDLNPRFAAICAVDWITSADPGAMAKAKVEAASLEALVEAEKAKVLTQKIAEEVKRLAIKLERGNKL
jgi:HEAT repeat protein